MELMEILIVVVGISILIILSYVLFTRTAEVSTSANIETSQYEVVTASVSNLFYSRIPEIDKSIAQLLADRIVTDNDMVYYGERYGWLNVTKIVYNYFDSYFDKRWNITIHTTGSIKNSVLWIPNSYLGNSISLITTEDGKEIGQYYTVPAKIYGNPSRVAVDSEGNVWVGNRGTRTIVKVGLLDNKNCVDKNGDGVIETSKDLNDDGVISKDEMLPFGSDECLLAEVFLGGSEYGNFDAGGVRAICLDSNDNVYAGIYNEKKLYFVSKDGVLLNQWQLPIPTYGCFVDKKTDIVWISGRGAGLLGRFDPATGETKTFNLGHELYGIAPCYNEDCLVVTSYDSAKLTKFNTTTNQIIFTSTEPTLQGGTGVTIDENENIYVAGRTTNMVSKYDKNGKLTAKAATCASPAGVGLDSYGKLWVTCIDSNSKPSTVRRYTKDLDPEIKAIFGTGHYVYNFFTSHNLKPIPVDKSISFGYPPAAERVRTFIIKFPLPQPTIGGIVNVVFSQW